MRFLFGVIIGIALTIGAALFHDQNLPPTPQTLADRPVVDWQVLGEVVKNATASVQRMWDNLMGRTPAPPTTPPAPVPNP